MGFQVVDVALHVLFGGDGQPSWIDRACSGGGAASGTEWIEPTGVAGAGAVVPVLLEVGEERAH